MICQSPIPKLSDDYLTNQNLGLQYQMIYNPTQTQNRKQGNEDPETKSSRNEKELGPITSKYPMKAKPSNFKEKD